MKEQNKFWLPTIVAISVILGVFIGMRLGSNSVNKFGVGGGQSKFDELLNYISSNYVDTLNMEKIKEESYVELLKQLDPHSSYISAEELKGVNEQLEGNFEGIGVEFFIVKDTIMVVNVISGGPSQQVGILSGDRIVTINDTLVAGKKITNENVIKKLRGKGGSKVKVGIIRGTSKKLSTYTITRGQIPLYSIDAAFMLNKEVGYIKVNRFAENTYIEFMQRLDSLLQKGSMKKLVIDLRGNGGGYLDAATKILDELIDGDKTLVYTVGRNRTRQDYTSHVEGMFEKGQVVVLVDEGSASASEIVSGALQDWDRGTIIGRRTFGKGLVQEQYQLSDGSALRLTVARYYTPSGRCIQKKYQLGEADYDMDVYNRYKHGELTNGDSIKNADTMKYYTMVKHRPVFAGGGVRPDIFVALDTTLGADPLIRALMNGGALQQFAYEYVAHNKATIAAFGSAEAFNRNFDKDAKVLNSLINSSVKDAKYIGVVSASARSFISRQLKAYIAKQVWGGDAFYYIYESDDSAIKAALKHLQ